MVKVKLHEKSQVLFAFVLGVPLKLEFDCKRISQVLYIHFRGNNLDFLFAHVLLNTDTVFKNTFSKFTGKSNISAIHLQRIQSFSACYPLTIDQMNATSFMLQIMKNNST